MKRVLSLLLVAAMLLAVPVMPVVTEAAAEANVTDPTSGCPCCGVPMDQLTWQPWDDSVGATPPAGHYYLTADYNQTSCKYVMAWDRVVLDLRGHKWSSHAVTTLPSFSGYRMMNISGLFYLMDTVGNGVVETELKPNYGGAFLMDYNEDVPEFHFLSGTIRPRSGEVNYKPGGLIYVNENSIFNMTGGVIENYRVEYKAGDSYSAGVDSSVINGGAILGSAESQIFIHGGVIRNCSASYSGGAISTAGKLELKNCTIVSCTAGYNGGAVNATSALTADNCSFVNCTAGNQSGTVYTTKTLTFNDCTLMNCSATEGGAVYASAALNMQDCTVLNCTSTGNGAGLYAKSTATLDGTTIRGCTSGKWGGGICMAGGTLNATDCTLDGSVAEYTNSYYNGGGNLFAMTSAKVNLTNCTVKNGYSDNQGGNIYVSGSTLTLTGTTVTGGVARTGDNIKSYNATTILDGATVNGDMIVQLGALTLKNATKVDMNGAGLVLYDNPTVTASELTSGAKIYVQRADAGTVAAAGADISYFRGAFRTTLSGGGTAAIIAAVAASGELGGYCPHCDAKVAWTAYTGQTATGHYYMTEDRTGSSTIASGADVVLDLNGKVLTGSTTGRALTNSTGGSLAIVDSGAGTYNGTTQWNGGVVQGSGSNGYNGGVVFNNGNFRLYGGTLRYVKDDARVVQRGGAVYNNGTFIMTGGILDASAYNNTASTGFVNPGETTQPAGMGGALWTYNNKTTTISAGRFIGGTAYAGGTAGFGTNVNVTITGGSFTGGTATAEAVAASGVATYGGGNLYFMSTTNSGSVQVSNISVTDGTAALTGGNIYFGSHLTNTFDNCFIANGTTTAASGYGGNAVMGVAGLVTVKNSIFLNGTAFSGGNIVMKNASGSITLDTCRLINGTTTGGAGSNGGNLMVSSGNVTVKGGELSYGVAGNSTGGVGGNICCGGAGTVTVQKNTAGDVTRIQNGYARFGGNITALGTVTLDFAVIGGGRAIDAGKDIQISGASAALSVNNGVTGSISMWPSEGTSLTYGDVISKTASNGLSAQLNIILEPIPGAKAFEKEGALYVGGVQLVNANGATAWYADYAAAEAVCGEDGYIKLYTNASLNLTKDTCVDLNGKTVTVSGSGKLLGMDSTGDSYATPIGKVTFSGTSPVEDMSLVYAPNGNKYVAMVDGNAVTFHRLGADLTAVTINTDKNAVYFKGAFGADETLKPLIDTYGIAVSLSGMPDEQLSDSMKTTYEGEQMENNSISKGVYIINILKEGLTADQNNNRGRDKIYATAYVTLKDGTTTYISDQSSTAEDDVAWSLYDAFNRLDTLIDDDPTNFRKYTGTMRNYYTQWKDKGIGDWVRQDTNFVQPEKDDTIDILMIGSSFCTYYVQELWQIANAAGVKLRVCNVYYSGCPLSKYYTDWVNGTAAYQYYETTGPERTTFAGTKSLEWCLAQRDWDVISMQEYSGNIRNDTVEAHLAKTDTYTKALFPYITSEFPEAKFYFHQTWSFQLGYNRNGYAVTTEAKQAEDAWKQQQFGLGLLEKYGDPATSGIRGAEFQCMDGRVPTGEAWQLVREGWNGYAKYDNLCKRKGANNNLGDYYHDGDIGGGQYLNALVWFFQVMKDQGKDFAIADIKWQPDNSTYGMALADGLNLEQLKACAYEAVYGDGWTYNAANYS